MSKRLRQMVQMRPEIPIPSFLSKHGKILHTKWPKNIAHKMTKKCCTQNDQKMAKINQKLPNGQNEARNTNTQFPDQTWKNIAHKLTKKYCIQNDQKILHTK